jgi:hypothetical protein
LVAETDAVYVCEPRGLGSSRWTRKNPPNYVERAHYLLGRTVESGRVWDLAATARLLRTWHGEQSPVLLAGEGTAAALSVYAALLEPDVAGLALAQLPSSHMEAAAPALLNVLKVLDIPEAVGLVAPRPVTLLGGGEWTSRSKAIYEAAGVKGRLDEQR